MLSIRRVILPLPSCKPLANPTASLPVHSKGSLLASHGNRQGAIAQLSRISIGFADIPTDVKEIRRVEAARVTRSLGFRSRCLSRIGFLLLASIAWPQCDDR